MRNFEMVKELVESNRLQEALIMMNDMFLENAVPKSDDLNDLLLTEFSTGSMIYEFYNDIYELSEDCVCLEDDDTFYKIEIVNPEKVIVSNITKESILEIIAEFEEKMKVA
jgi:predicted RNA-binding protein with PUA domain